MFINYFGVANNQDDIAGKGGWVGLEKAWPQECFEEVWWLPLLGLSMRRSPPLSSSSRANSSSSSSSSTSISISTNSLREYHHLSQAQVAQAQVAQLQSVSLWTLYEKITTSQVKQATSSTKKALQPLTFEPHIPPCLWRLKTHTPPCLWRLRREPSLQVAARQRLDFSVY